MKKIVTILLISSLLLTACGNAATSEESSAVSESSAAESSEVSENSEEASADSENNIEESSTGSSEGENEQEIDAEETVQVYSSDVDLTAIGGDGIDWDYCFKYNSIPGDLITYIGDAEFDAWVQDKSTAPHTMQSCIEHFGLTVDDVMQALNPPETTEYAEVLTVSDIETLCSGDQAAINKNFVSPYAAVSEKGDIYTIFWLAEHGAEDYADAGLTAEAVEAALSSCTELGIEAVDGYVAQAEVQAAALADSAE